ncbi:cytochrome P450 [Streptosporangium amethystogenes subsp. fukuiense]|uniref:Cytochrome P450 n=1 Tax=Streptosporangium amethystogenes subsp. fukuiense TaxID=698418 RepID=A0ABW2SXG6_9ACTN
MTSDPLVVSGHAQVRAVLADPRFTVDPVPRPPFALSVAWLRGAVGRFAEGSTHAGRRAAGEAVLAGLDPDALRAEAVRLASQETGPPPCPPELIPVLVLAVALGVPVQDGPSAVEAVTALAPAYLPGPEEVGTEAADEGLARLARLLGDPAPERLAVLAGLLAQACGPTAGLVRGALARAAASRPVEQTVEQTVEELLDETLRRDPPVRTLRRRAPGDGRAVVLDIAAANRDPRALSHLTFGAGPRACPGRRVALALAAGTVEAVAR